MDTIDPVKYSVAENRFLLENVGKAPIVALKHALPEGVNPRAVRPVLQEVYDREQLRTAEGVAWVGIEKVKEALERFVKLDEQWEHDYQRTRGRIPRYPTLYSKDGKGKYHLYGPGSDAGIPQTYLASDGTRQRLAVELDGYVNDYQPEGVKEAPKSLLIAEDKHRLECPICHHTESFKEGSKSSQNAARARMATHLKRTTDEVDLHRELYTNEYGA